MIPYAELRTLFLDVGNTLISIDFHWVSEELRSRGIDCGVEELLRAEANGRPALSKALGELRSTEAPNFHGFYLENILRRVSGAANHSDTQLAALVKELNPVLRESDSRRLWSLVMPGVPEALARLRGHGLQLVVVSNSDGTVERELRDQGLRDHFDVVIDSQRVGFEKPDPRIFEVALERSGADPERTLHVGDLYSADVVGARSAGLHALLLDPYDDWPPVDCPTLADVTALCERLTEG